jgi:long-chain acyl-CoA synthetase
VKFFAGLYAPRKPAIFAFAAEIAFEKQPCSLSEKVFCYWAKRVGKTLLVGNRTLRQEVWPESGSRFSRLEQEANILLFCQRFATFFPTLIRSLTINLRSIEQDGKLGETFSISAPLEAGICAAIHTLGDFMHSAAPAYPWLTHYPSNVDWAAPLEPRPVFALLEEAAARFPDNDCIDFQDKRFTYAEIKELSDRAAKGLRAAGFKPGMKLGLFLPNCPWFVVFYFAGLKAGGVIVNFNPLYVEPEIARQIEDSETDFMVTLDLAVMLPKLTAVLDQTRLQRIIVCPMAEQLPFPKNFMFPLVMRRAIAHPPAEDTRYIPMRALLENDGAIELPKIDPVTTLAVLQYTGGTTGVPKGAMLSHANIYVNAQQIRLWFRAMDNPETRIVGVLPLFHAFAMTCIMNLTLCLGSCMLLEPRFEVKKLLKLIAHKKPNAMAGVPTLFNAMLNAPGVKDYDLSSLELCISGGAALPQEIRRAFEEKTGSRLLEGYGLSEASPVCCVNPPDKGSKPGSIGMPLPGTICEIVSIEDGKTMLPAGETGEICFRGPQVMMGYWKKPEATAEVITDGGRLHTGDVGHIDEEGYVFITDRLKEMINASGFKVYPRLVEEAIYQHPAVREAAVIGIPDPYRGQTVKAYVALKAGMALTAEELDAFLVDRLSKIEKPTAYEFRADLPKTVIGKIQKKILIEEAAANSAAAQEKIS